MAMQFDLKRVWWNEVKEGCAMFASGFLHMLYGLCKIVFHPWHSVFIHYQTNKKYRNDKTFWQDASLWDNGTIVDKKDK